MTILVIVQARMGSTRLPGKVLLTLNNEPVLKHVLSRLNTCQRVDQVMLAIPDTAENKPLVELAELNHTSCFLGSELNVLERFYLAAKESQAEHIVRICSDCPLIDPKLIDYMLGEYIELNQDKGVQYLSNSLERTFPRGLDAEIFSFAALESAFQQADQDFQKVHVTPYIYQNPKKFKHHAFKNELDYSNYRWTLDTQQDYDFLSELFSRLKIRSDYFPTTHTIIEYLIHHPDILKLNQDVEQKPLEMC